MKSILALIFGTWVACVTAHATIYTYNFDVNNGLIPDGDAAGWSDTRNLDLSIDFGPLPEGTTTEIVDVNVRLNISGGYNGDLYGYLVHDSGFAVLLNRIGRTSGSEFGSTGAGFSILLDDEAGADVHSSSYSSGAVLSGAWQPDGRETDPDFVLDTDARTAMLNSFIGLSANGGWTLFLADLSPGDESVIVSWSLEISTVPEPTEWALLIFGSLAVVGRCVLPRLRPAGGTKQR